MNRAKHLDLGCGLSLCTSFNTDRLYELGIIALLKNILCTLNYRSKTHIVWEFKAIKES